MIGKLIAVIALMFLTTACANQALFTSNPIGAQVHVNGNPIGITPCTFEYSSSSGDTYEVTLEKTGFETLQRSMKADEIDTSARNSWLAAGVVWSPLWLGTFFTNKLKDSYQFILQQKSPVVASAILHDAKQRKSN